jgi:hypothetical protein
MSKPIYILTISKRKDKKYMIITPDNKKINFGGIKPNEEPYSDFTHHHDEERKERYINRHKKNENFNDLNTSGAWSRWLLWEKPTMNESIKNMEKQFNIKIKVQI